MNKNERLEIDLAAEHRAAFSRRRFLRGLGACLAVPAFESLRIKGTQAALANSAATSLATTASGVPLRTAFLYFPNGASKRTGGRPEKGKTSNSAKP